jgi:coenzyme F420-reducing hydrogenase beta subunit
MDYKTVCDKDKCCGCNACVVICPKNAIRIIDSVSTLNAKIDSNLCVNCKLCEAVCQICNPTNDLLKYNKSQSCYEGVTKNSQINNVSSSGGFATTLGLRFIENGGYVVGVRNDFKKFQFDITNDPSVLMKFAGSKYVKVSPKNIYLDVEKRLKLNKVLFIGLPCQVAGLKMYLKREYDNLYTIDLVCHGTPSEKVLEKYLNEYNIESTKDLSFRNKRHYQLSINGKRIDNKRYIDSYSFGFSHTLFLTKNCYTCNYAQPNRISDLTIGDSWGSINEGKNGYNCLSLILQNNDKGNELLKIIDKDFTLMKCDYNNALNNNRQLNYPSRIEPYTNYFFDNFHKKTINSLVFKAYPKEMFKQLIKMFLIKLHLKKM